ncbi:MAG: hypothetical protein ACPLX8_00950, partial [Nanopusillaceae archaeon]
MSSLDSYTIKDRKLLRTLDFIIKNIGNYNPVLIGGIAVAVYSYLYSDIIGNRFYEIRKTRDVDFVASKNEKIDIKNELYRIPEVEI